MSSITKGENKGERGVTREGRKGLDLLAVVLYRWSRGRAMNTK